MQYINKGYGRRTTREGELNKYIEKERCDTYPRKVWSLLQSINRHQNET